MSITPGMVGYKLSFECSPVILTGGIAGAIPGGMIPIVSLTEALNFVDGLLSGGADLDLDDFFAHFQPLAGATIISQQIGKYPFANQATAANAVIAQPLRISMRMVCPARGDAGYAFKLATIMALQATLRQHNASGGTYTVVTPSFFYTDCVMLDMADTSLADSKQPQNTWQLDFEKPLLTLADAQQAQNNLMSRITAGVPIDGTPAWSGLGPTVGVPSSLAAVGTIPAATNPLAASTASPLFQGGPLG